MKACFNHKEKYRVNKKFCVCEVCGKLYENFKYIRDENYNLVKDV